jgi:hypothetical protein
VYFVETNRRRVEVDRHPDGLTTLVAVKRAARPPTRLGAGGRAARAVRA